MKINEERLSEAVTKCDSVAAVLRFLGYKSLAGGTHHHISKRIKRSGLDTSHFVNRYENSKKHVPSRKLSAEQILICRTQGKREHVYKLRRAMIESGIEHLCSSCGLPPVWNGKQLVLEVDHIDNNFLNNVLLNLRFLCPNCHSQRVRNLNKRMILSGDNLDASSEERLPLCQRCGKTTKGFGKTCRGCRPQCIKPKPQKIDWPSLDVLLKAKSERKVFALGKLLGVSDVAIHKRIASLT